MSHQDESRRHHGYEKLCDQLMAECDAAKEHSSAVSKIYRDLLESHVSALIELRQWRQLGRSIEVVPPMMRNQAS